LGAIVTAAFGMSAISSRHSVAAASMAASMLLCTARMSMVGVRPKKDKVIISSFLWSRSLRWTDVESFCVGAVGRYPCVGQIKMADGRRLSVLGLATSAHPSDQARTRVHRLVDELNDELSRHIAV
jgi:hypothetical protein